jgi:hypothetical protein
MAYIKQVPPVITLNVPISGGVVTGQAQLTALVDDDAPLARVQFYVDGVALGTPLASEPFLATWDTARLNTRVAHTVSVTATDVLGRSSNSETISVQVDNGPAISRVAMSPGMTATSAHVSWSTDVLADGQVEFGPTIAYGSATPVDDRPDWRHEMILTGLRPESIYHYRVRSRDANGAVAISEDQVFFTPAP